MTKEISAKRFHSLDAFRGLAAILIILFHSQFYAISEPNQFIRHSDIFVDFFFILSGFVIAYSYQSKIMNGMKFKDFILLRFARLYPLHIFVLFVWIPYIGIKIYLYNRGIGATDPTELNNAVTFVKNLFLLQGMGSRVSWNYPSWSIGAEFYTYILFFIILFFSKKLFVLQRIFVISLVALLSYIIANSSIIAELRFVGLFSCISEFLFGVIIYYMYEQIHLKAPPRTIVASFLEIGMLMLLIFFVSNIDESNNYKHYTIALFVVIVYFFAIQNKGIVSQVLNLQLFQYLGRISYSIYMTHAIIVTGTYNVLMYIFKLQIGGVEGVSSGIIFEYANFLDLLLVALVIGVSTLTYKYIEIPAQKHFRKKVYSNEK